MTQSARQLPARSTDSSGVLDDEYGYDANGNVSHIYDLKSGAGYSPNSRWMSYDGLDRLTGVGAGMFGGTDNWHHFTYNALDNLTSWKLAGVKDYATYVYDASNRLTGIQNTAGATIVGLSYDAQGNLKNRNGQNYDFDYGNRLREVTGKEYYWYDGHGRRVLAWVPVTGSILSQYTLDGKLFYQEDQRTGARLFNLYLGNNLVAIREVTTQLITKYQHTDALGSPVAVTNEAGQVIQRNDYEPYGTVINQPTYGGLGFTGHVQDAATGLTYMQQRYYDPLIGRFLSVDPVTAYSSPGANFNRYWYANNNPYRFNDPDGRLPWPMPANFNVGSADITRARASDLEKTASAAGNPEVAAVAKSVSQGMGTLQVGVVVSGSAGAGGKVGAGVVVDGKGNAGFYAEYGVSTGPQADANASITAHVTNAESIQDLQGQSVDVSAGAGAIAHGSGDVSYAQDRDGTPVVGAGFTVGPGAGAGGSVGVTHTTIVPVIDKEKK